MKQPHLFSGNRCKRHNAQAGWQWSRDLLFCLSKSVHHLREPANRSRTFRFAESDCARITLKVLYLHRAARMSSKDLFGPGSAPTEECASDPSPLKCGMHPAEEEDARLHWIWHAVGKSPSNSCTVWCDCNQRVVLEINVAPCELFHHVVD
jgi:hypothetical protein